MVKKKQCEFKDEDSSTESNDDARVRNPAAGEVCVHVKNSIHTQTVRKRVKSAGGLDQACGKCAESKSAGRADPGPEPLVSDLLDYDEPDPSLWMCLKCGSQLCGRSVNQHALEHYKTPRSESHALCLNTTRFQVWCYQCDQEVNPKAVPRLADIVDYVRQEAKVAAMKNVTSVEQPPPPPPTIENLEQTIASAVNSIRTLAAGGDGDSTAASSGVTNSTMVYGPQPKPATTSAPNYRDIRLDIGGGGTGRKLPAIATSSLSIVDSLPRLRGLSNLGNTCFFNAVVQCLTRTPYLLDVLRESSVQGEKFQLPGGPLKLKDGTVTELSPISGELNPWGSFTQVLAESLSELQSGGGVFSPSKLFSQLTNKWPQFAGMDQHDSHELLRHLLESVRSEDLRRYQLVILLSLGYGKRVDPNTVEDTMKEKIKFYGTQASDRILGPEPVFRGFLVSTLTCQDCYHVSARHESFLDLSLPINSEKPQPPIRRKGSPEPDYGYSASTSGGATPKPLSSRERRRIKKATKTKEKAEKTQQINNDLSGEPEADDKGGEAAAPESDKDDDGMSDADVEDNLTDDSQPKKSVDQNGNQSGGPEKRDDAPENPNKEGESSNVVCELGLSAEGVANMMEKMSLEQQEAKAKARRQRTVSHADWGNTLAPRYQCEDNECSIQSCLNAFTAVELMAGNNKVCCDACTERINGKDGKSVNTNATKQFLISSPPAVLILHLKRFQVGPRGMFRKMTKTVTFPFVLDIAPFCGSRVKKLPTVRPGQKKLLYSLYGIVEHSGTMHGGHYVAYVKVRPQLAKDDPRWTFLPKGSKAELDQKDEEAIQLEKELAREQARGMTAAAAARDSDDALTSSSSTSSSRSSTGTTSDGEECEGAVGYTPKPELLPDVDPPPGKWYYVSDSHVRETTEDSVLNAQAYLLFYERIF
ncbi:ubiquitin carboxyl-terminal hydrolase 16 [Culex quinquefasciatus]|uniref:ubiquitin carboxyl-terminal hydrolase 16 n=1 Tax=Culex quinquefasciatus TaxID=7176 RepID=UPI0018E3D6B6|nr:ubiquitin carboxyl-terminal hydrolase 16 [Culex quinquefasciatus]